MWQQCVWNYRLCLMLLALLIRTSYLSLKVNYDISQVAFHIILEDNGHNNNFERCVNHRNHKKKKKKNHFQIKNLRRFYQQEYSQWLVLWTGDTSFIMDIETTFSNNFPCRQLRISTITLTNLLPYFYFISPFYWPQVGEAITQHYRCSHTHL